jgi:hypothetical protein
VDADEAAPYAARIRNEGTVLIRKWVGAAQAGVGANGYARDEVALSRLRLASRPFAVCPRLDGLQRFPTIPIRAVHDVHREERHLEGPVGDAHDSATCRTKGSPHVGHKVANTGRFTTGPE